MSRDGEGFEYDDEGRFDYMDYGDDDDFKCATCNGTGQVNPLTPNLPKDFLCLGADECPSCEGTGEI